MPVSGLTPAAGCGPVSPCPEPTGTRPQSASAHPLAERAHGEHPTTARTVHGRTLTPQEEEEVEELRRRDAEVRRHEAAHKAAAGQYARGGPTFEYQTGPDGRAYAVGGEVSIDTSPIPNDPRATIRKADAIRRAALAPEEPSAQDRKVAAEAEAMRARAMKELAEETGGDPLEVRASTYAPGRGGSGEPAVRRHPHAAPGERFTATG